MGINSSSVSHYSTKRLHGSPLPDNEMPEAEIAGSRGGTGCRSSMREANPTVLRSDICSPGQHYQMVKNLLSHSWCIRFLFQETVQRNMNPQIVIKNLQKSQHCSEWQ